MKITNKTAHYNYFIFDTYEAGIKLTGTEIKSVRAGNCNITDSYIIFKNSKPWIMNMYIAKYTNGNIFNHEERRTRELLLHKKEIIKLQQKIKLDGVTLIPLQAYFKKSLLKIEFAVGKGKNLHDKRETIKKRDLEREDR